MSMMEARLGSSAMRDPWWQLRDGIDLHQERSPDCLGLPGRFPHPGQLRRRQIPLAALFRVITGWGIRAITGNNGKARHRCTKKVSARSEISSNLDKLPTISLAMERSTVQSCLAAPVFLRETLTPRCARVQTPKPARIPSGGRSRRTGRVLRSTPCWSPWTGSHRRRSVAQRRRPGIRRWGKSRA